MENKPSMSRVERLHREKVTRYSIRKYSFGAASVAVAALFMFLGNGAVSANELSKQETSVEATTPTLDKTQLESYISEIETKLSNGSYDNKTEESVAVLKADLEAAKATLANATTQAELKKAYSKLVTTANSKLKNKPVEKKETPEVDTTEGKETVGKKAGNTEPKSESNSIENTGSNDARSGKELDKNNVFRTETDTEKPKVSIDYDDPASKTFWITPTEETNITNRIKITDNSGKIVKGWMQKMGGGTDINVGYGLNNSNIDGETTATAAQPATLSVTGTLQRLHPNGKPWPNGSTIVSRKVRAKDASNNEIDNEGSSDPDYQVFFKVRSQNVKYTEDLAKKAANFDKVAVADPAQLQQPELDKIKAKLQEGADNNLNGKIATVTQAGDKVVITYNDGTTAERPVTDFARVNVAPTAEFPFSNARDKEIYVYGAEENSFDIKIKDDSGKISSATLRQGGNRTFAEVPGATNKISTQYGYTANTITAETPATEASPAVITYSGTPAPEGNFTQDKLDAATRGETPPGVVLGWRFLRVTDADGGEIGGSATGADDPGSFVVILKPQTQKYDVTTPENEAAKLPVADANNVTAEEFAKIVGENNANIKLHYSKTNTDANLVGKQGQNVDDKDAKIKSVTKVDNNMVVTYKDGSTDTLPLTKFARTNAAPTVEIPYSVEGKKDVYVYANEDFEIPVKFTDDSGKVASATIKRGGNQDSPAKDASNPDVLDNQYNTTVEKISTETPATAENPAIVKIKGNISKDNSGIAENKFPKEAGQELTIVTRYATATDTDGAFIENTATSNSYATDPGSFTIKLKAQTAKYDIKDPETKVPVVDANNVTDAEFEAIKDSIKIQYSTENPDKNLADKKGKDVDDQNDRIESITKDGNNVVVTYKDGSKDSRPLTDFARTNPAPTVELPYSNADKRQIYVYTGENTDLTFTGKDETEVKDLYLRGPGDVTWNNTTGFGFTTGKVENGVVTGDGTVTPDKRTATIKMTGTTNLKAGQQWTSFIESKDSDDAKSMTGANYNAETDDAARQQKPGYVQFVVKSQTDKYDIKAPTEKVAVTDPANVTEAELAKIKEKLQLEHNKNNDDANISKNAPVTDKDAKIASVTKDDQGNLVVTYADGSKDTRPLSEFVTLDKQPAIDEVNKAADEQIKVINDNAAATQEEKDAAIEQVNADKAKALQDIANSTATTKPELDAVEKAGTDKIKQDNPVISKKPAAKQAIDDALKAKEAAIDARTDLSDKEKAAAKLAAKNIADAAKKAIDNATTDADVETAQTTGTDNIATVNPIAKEAAKQAVADELAKKEAAIDARDDLTQEEKDAAKKEAQAKAKEATDAINAQPDTVDTPEEATDAQTAVDGAKDKGVADVKAVNPVAKAKPEAKKAIDKALEAKNQEIDARTDLTPEEKTKAKEAAKAQADVAKDAVDAATTNAEVDKAKADGTTAVANVTPVAKEEAKKAIAKALEDKNAEIDKRTDLTDEEKTAAKNEAKDKADAQLAEIAKQPDAAATPTAAKTAQDAVDAAKAKGVADVKAVNPVAKEKAKEEIAKELAKKEEAIDGRKDLTDEEKDAAKKDAQAKAKEATDAIDAQPSIAETPEKAAEAKKAVDGAKDKGVADVKAVNPVAAKKPEAKAAVDAALKAKVDAINAREDLTPAEKDEAKKAAEKAADDAKKAIDAATTDAAVDAAKNAGTGEVAKVNPVAKEKAKEEIAKELAKKEEAIDERKDLTDEEKAAAKEEAQAKAKEATDAINDQPANAETPEKAAEAQKAVDGAKDKGVDEVAAVNPEAVTKPAAKKAIEDKLAKQLEDIANTPDATDEEKKVAADAAKALAEEAKEEIDKAGTDAEVKQLQEAAEGEIEKSVPVVEDKPNARKAIDEEATAKKAEIDARNDLTPEAKAKLKAKVDKVAEKSKAAIDAVSSVDDVNTIEEADKAAIKAIGEVNRPIDKVLVKDPSALTDEEKAKILEEVKKVNPTAKEVKYDENGNIEVTTEAGDKGIINPTKLVKTEDQLDNGKGGNDINKPLDKVIVKDPSNLTDEEKAKIVAKVEEVNPDAIVTIDENGTVSVSTPEGKTAAIPASELVRTKEDTSNPDAGNSKIVKPADKVAGEANDPDDQAKVEEKLRELNPETKSVKFDEDGNATVTLKDGTTATIPSEDLFKSEVDATKPNAGNDIVKPADKTVVANPEKLTDAEKKAIEDKVKAVNPDATVVVDDKGNATVTTPEGKTAVIPAADLTKDPEAATKPNAGNDIVKPADKTVVANPEKLTDAEKKAIEDKVKAVNPDATVVVDDKGNATVTTPEGKTAVIPAADLTKDPAAATKPNAGNDIVKPADKTVVANPEKLTDAEKKAIEDKVKAVNPDATVVVDDKGNATVTTPEGKTAVIPAADLTKSSDAEKAPKAGNDIVKPASKTKVANPDALTLEEKKAIADKVSAVNPGSTVVVDDKGNATVTLPNGKIAVIPASDLTKSEKDVNDGKAKDNAVTPASKTKVANPEKLTDAEKKAIADKVKAANPGAEVVVDDKGNATVVKDGNVSVIPSTDLVKVQDDATKPNGGNDANTPAAKTVVKDPAELQDVEKKAIEDKVSAVNPGSTVVVDDQGNATVTKGDGTVLNIPASDLVIPAEKLADEATNAKVKTPAIRTLVGNKDSLTDTEKAAVKKSIEAVNPGATVVVDDKGNATVTMPDGSTATISKEQLVKDKDAVSKSKHGGDNLDIDLSKVEVADLANITPEEKAKFQYQVLGAITDVPEFDLDAFLKETDDNGNTVYTSKDGKVKITIDKDGNATATVEKDGKTEAAVKIDKDGNVTIVTKEGQVLAIPRDDAFKQRPYVPSNGGGNNGATNTDAKVDKAKLEGAIHQLDELIIKESAKLDAETAKEANDLLADAKKVFANADATQAEVDAMVKRIEDFMAKVAPSTDHATPANDQSAQTSAVAPATTQAAANASQEAATNARKAAKELPNTGTANSTVAMVAAAASALLGLGLAGRRRKEDEEA